MKTIVVFPICDLRRIHEEPDLALDKPLWALPQPHKEFIRALGGLKDLRDCSIDLRGLDGWIVEPFVCDITSGPKFYDMPAMKTGGHFAQWKVDNRLLFFDSISSARVEYHLSVALSKASVEISIDQLNDYLCGLKLKIRMHEGMNGAKFEEVDFGRSGLLHARALVARTISKKQFPEIRTIRSYVRNLRPAIIHLIDYDENINIGDNFVSVDNTCSRFFEILHDRIRIFNNIDIPIWIVKSKKNANKRDIRDLSLYLRRLHSEYECLKSIVREIVRGSVVLENGYLPENLEAYLKDLLSHVKTAENKLNRRGKMADLPTADQPNMVELASISIHDLDPGLNKQIQDALRAAKFKWRSNGKQIEEFFSELNQRAMKIELNVRTLNMNTDNRQTVKNSTGVTLTQAGRDAQVKIDKSFNRFQETGPNAELVQAVADLKELVDQAIEAGEINDPRTIERDFKEMAEEIASDQPRKPKIKMSGELIVGAIKESSGLISAVMKAVEVIEGFFK